MVGPHGRLIQKTHQFRQLPAWAEKSYDVINSVALDPSGNIFLTGLTGTFSQPPPAGAFQPITNYGCIVLGLGPPVFTAEGNAFVMKLDPKASAVLGLTYLGSRCSFGGNAIVDSSGSPWISGSPGFLPSFLLPKPIADSDRNWAA